MPQGFYDEEEADAILRLAAQKPVSGGMSRERLIATAAELGISEQAVEEAEQSLQQSKQEADLRAEFDVHKKREFWTQFGSYLSTIGFFGAINFFTGLESFWAVWIIVPCLVGLVTLFFKTFFKNSCDYEDAYDRWRLKKEGKLTGMGNASDLIREWLAVHPGDAAGAADYVKETLEIDHSKARKLVRQQLNQ